MLPQPTVQNPISLPAQTLRLPRQEPSNGQVFKRIAAPNFSLPDDQNGLHQLSARQGQFTVIYFYPADNTPGCAAEACAFRTLYELFEQTGVEVWGISPQGPQSKAGFREKYQLPFILLADVDRTVAGLYGADPAIENPLGLDQTNPLRRTVSKWFHLTRRVSFLVAPDGMIVRYWPKVNPKEHAGLVWAALQEEQRSLLLINY
jgi:peroxiredoxin Q/BCP